MRALRSRKSGSLKDRIREQAGVKVSVVSRIEKSKLSQFGHMERMD